MNLISGLDLPGHYDALVGTLGKKILGNFV